MSNDQFKEKWEATTPDGTGPTVSSGNISQTSPLIGVDGSGCGYFISNLDKVPGSLIINHRSKTQLTNEQFTELWREAFDPPCPSGDSEKATRVIDGLIKYNLLTKLKLLEAESPTDTQLLLWKYGMEPMSASQAELKDAFPSVTPTPGGAGYFLAKWGKQSLCIRNDPKQSGISHEDLGDVLEVAFPAGTIQACRTNPFLAVTAKQSEFFRTYLSENKVQLYLPLDSTKAQDMMQEAGHQADALSQSSF